MEQFRKKPVVIEAVEWTGNNLREIIDFTGLHESAKKWTWEEYEDVVAEAGLKIFTLEGSHMATIGDWIIKGVKGEFYPCKPDIFEQTYEAVATMNNVLSSSRQVETLVSPQTHELKTWKVFFEPMWNNLKNFEIRWNDRDYKVGDRLRLMEYDNIERKYTGRFICKTIIYMTNFAQESGYVVMQLDERLSG